MVDVTPGGGGDGREGVGKGKGRGRIGKGNDIVLTNDGY